MSLMSPTAAMFNGVNNNLTPQHIRRLACYVSLIYGTANKIEAIKAFRGLTGAALKDAKDAVEWGYGPGYVAHVNSSQEELDAWSLAYQAAQDMLKRITVTVTHVRQDDTYNPIPTPRTWAGLTGVDPSEPGDSLRRIWGVQYVDDDGDLCTGLVRDSFTGEQETTGTYDDAMKEAKRLAGEPCVRKAFVTRQYESVEMRDVVVERI